MNNRNNALDDLIKQERLAYQKRVRRLREQARKEEERLALRTAEIIRTEHPDTYSKYEEEARRLLEEERLARSSRGEAFGAVRRAAGGCDGGAGPAGRRYEL